MWWSVPADQWEQIVMGGWEKIGGGQGDEEWFPFYRNETLFLFKDFV
jgi:hypothetical protein